MDVSVVWLTLDGLLGRAEAESDVFEVSDARVGLLGQHALARLEHASLLLVRALVLQHTTAQRRGQAPSSMQDER